MRAVTIVRPGGPEMLQMREMSRPEPGPGSVRVAVRAAGVNRADALQRMGRYPAPAGVPADIPGLEVAGVVDALGSGVAAWRVGDRVMALTTGGGYAEEAIVPAGHLIPIPASWSFEIAAAVPEAFLTAYDALERRVAAHAGEHALVHAVGSKVGVALLQLATARGCEVAGTSRTPAKLERARALGLAHPILVSNTFAPDPAFTDWADVICDLVGAPYLAGNLKALASRGRMVVIGLTGGRAAELDMGRLLNKRATIVGTVLRSRSDQEKMDLVDAFRRDVMPLFEQEGVRAVVDRTVPMDQAAEAHRHMEANRNFGAIVLRW